MQANIRGRDTGSFVAEAQARLDAEVSLPEGYFITWGGQFENLARARGRLMIVVPLALSLIFIMLSPRSATHGTRSWSTRVCRWR